MISSWIRCFFFDAIIFDGTGTLVYNNIAKIEKKNLLKILLQFNQNLNRNLKKKQCYGVKQLFFFEMSRHTTM